MQQLTCKIDFSNSFYYLFFSFVLLELKPFVLKGKVLGEKLLKKCEKVRKIVKNYETILPFSCCPLVFPRLMPLFLMGCFPEDFREGKRPIKAFGEPAH